jgi:hypothetical protein
MQISLSVCPSGSKILNVRVQMPTVDVKTTYFHRHSVRITIYFLNHIPFLLAYTGLLKMIVGVLTTCHTQYTWDRSICICLFNRTTLQVFVTCLTGALYVHSLWFYKHQHDNRVRSTQNAVSLPFAAILVNCAPSGEMHNYCTPHIMKENSESLDPSVQIHTPISSVLCMTSC